MTNDSASGLCTNSRLGEPPNASIGRDLFFFACILLLGLTLGCQTTHEPGFASVHDEWLKSWRTTNPTWRGVHFGIGNDRQVESLIQQLPRLEAVGVNAIIVEVNYSFEFQSHPELRPDDFVTKARARELAEAAREHGIRLIPQLNCLGHQSWAKNTLPLLVKYPQFDETPGKFPNNTNIYCRSWCPQNPEVNKVVFALIDELIDGFNADAFHVGMDEVFLLASEYCPRCHGGDPARLFAKAVNDLHGHIVGKRKLEMLLWGDRLLDANQLKHSEWEASRNGTAAAIDLVPKDLIVCDWHYGKRAEYPSVPLLLAKGFRVWPSGWQPLEASKAFSAFARQQKNPRMLGYLCTTWNKTRIPDAADWPPIREVLQDWNELDPMKEILPTPPAVVRNEAAAIQALFHQNVVPSYGRFELVLSHGSGSYVYDISGKRYLDLGGGIAVSALGHAHPAMTEALVEQSRKLIHISNFYYHEAQGRLAQSLVGLLGAGKCFFCNSGVEANEGLFKLARKFGHDEGRFEIITTLNSFHGRTLAAIAATGQEKVKKGFEPMVPGFRQVPYNDLEAMRAAISPATVALLVEGIQGEGGVMPATQDYLLGLRRLCDEKRLLLLMDGVQDGHFRTGRFQSFQRIFENGSEGQGFLPDAISMAKSLGGGFPVGAFWIRAPYADVLNAGTHGTTYGGSPLACAVALKILDVIQKERLADNARQVGDYLKRNLQALAQKFPGIIKDARGLGLMLGVELAAISNLPGEPGKSTAVRFANLLHAAGLLTIPAGAQILRLLPPLNLRQSEAEEGLKIFESVCAKLAG